MSRMEPAKGLDEIELADSEREVLESLQKQFNKPFRFQEWPEIEGFFERLPISIRDHALPAYAENGHVKKLEFYKCDLNAFPEEICALRELSVLSLCGNNLAELPESVGNLTQLRMFSLAENNFTRVPEALRKFAHLTHFSMAKNHLNTFPDFLLQNTELTGLNLAINNIPSIPGEIGVLKQLRKLLLSANPLGSVPPALFTLRNLMDLELEQTGIESVPDSLCDLGDLQYLNLNGNHLRQIPQDIGRLAKLQNLRLADNRLQSVPDSMGSLPKLSLLDLRNNQITAFPKSFKDFTRPSMALHGNPFPNIPENLPLGRKIDIVTNDFQREYMSMRADVYKKSGGELRIVFRDRNKEVFRIEIESILDANLNVFQSIVREIAKVADTRVAETPSFASTPAFRQDCSRVLEQNEKIAKKNKLVMNIRDPPVFHR